EPPEPVPFPHVPLEVPLAAVAELPQTVSGALAGAVVPLPDTGPLLSPDPVDPELLPGARVEPPEPVPFPQVPLEVPLAAVAELPHTVSGALAGAVVPLPDPPPLLLPLPVKPEFDPGEPAGLFVVPQSPLEVPLAAVAALPQTVSGAPTGAVVPLPDTGPLLSPDPVDPVLLPGPTVEPEPPEPVEFPQVPLEVPLPAVAELPHTVSG